MIELLGFFLLKNIVKIPVGWACAKHCIAVWDGGHRDIGAGAAATGGALVIPTFYVLKGSKTFVWK